MPRKRSFYGYSLSLGFSAYLEKHGRKKWSVGGKGRGGKVGARVEKRVGGKRRLEEKDVRWVMGRKVGVVRGLGGKLELVTGLEEGEKGWTNEEWEIVREGVEVDMIGEDEGCGK